MYKLTHIAEAIAWEIEEGPQKWPENKTRYAMVFFLSAHDPSSPSITIHLDKYQYEYIKRNSSGTIPDSGDQHMNDTSENLVLERIKSEIHGMLAFLHNMARPPETIIVLGPDKIKALKELSKAIETEKKVKLLVEAQTNSILKIIKMYCNLKSADEVDLSGETAVEKAMNEVWEFLNI